MTTNWTRDETIANRAKWNDAVRAGRLHTPRDQAALEARLGYTIGDIKAAVDAHDLDGKRAAREAWLTTPDGLRSQRGDLLRAYRVAAGYEDARDDDDDFGVAPDRSRSRAALDAVDAFDAAHPEVVSAILAETTSGWALRNVWN